MPLTGSNLLGLLPFACCDDARQRFKILEKVIVVAVLGSYVEDRCLLLLLPPPRFGFPSEVRGVRALSPPLARSTSCCQGRQADVQAVGVDAEVQTRSDPARQARRAGRRARTQSVDQSVSSSLLPPNDVSVRRGAANQHKTFFFPSQKE